MDVVVRPDGTFVPPHADTMAGDAHQYDLTGASAVSRNPHGAQIALGEMYEIDGRDDPCHGCICHWPFLMRGIASGGVMAGMLTHSVLGRAVLCVSESGLQGLSLASSEPGVHGQAAACAAVPSVNV